MATVSVIVPTFNRVRFVAETIQSVATQTYTDYELIIVDDGSTDGTLAVIKAQAISLTLIEMAQNSGPGHARNAGVAHASGEFVAFLDSDDVWEPNHLESSLARIQSDPDCGLVYAAKSWIGPESTPLGIPTSGPNPEGWIYSRMLEGNYISSASCVLVRTSVFRGYGGFPEDPPMSIGEDYNLWLRIAARHKILFTGLPTVRYRRHDGNLHNDAVAIAKGHIRTRSEAGRAIMNGEFDARNNVGPPNGRTQLRRAHEELIYALYTTRQFSEMTRVMAAELRGGIFRPRNLKLIGKAAIKHLLNRF
jgi:glycosyltransferase involved in cell wall biosynthesis